MSAPTIGLLLLSALPCATLGCRHCAPTTPLAPTTRGFTTGGIPTRDTITAAAQWGANSIRVWVNIPQDAPPERYWDDFEATTVRDAETAVRNAEGTGVKVVLSCGSFIPGVDRDQHAYWSHPDLERLHVEAWRRIARRLLPLREHIVGYDLINEPLDRSVLPAPPEAWRDLAIKIIAGIREVDQDTWIIFEPGPGGTCAGFFDLEPLPDAKVIYSAHYYFPHVFTHQGIHSVAGTELTQAMEQVNLPYPLPVAQLKGDTWELVFHRVLDLTVFDRAAIDRIAAPALAFQRTHNVPMYLGEFSVVRWAPHDSAVRYLGDVVDFCETNGWSWSYHSFREFNGWSLEHGDTLDWIQGMSDPPRPPALTDRARLLLKALARNGKPLQDLSAVEAGQSQRSKP
jgi:aryl-phospho-beta-D-glucosidase BglC (GH1 family)